MEIDYGYFRHRFDASDDPKLQKLVDEIGIVGLGYWWSLLEIYGRFYTQKKEETEVEIHIRVIANAWRKRVDSCHKVLTKLQLSGLLVVTKCPQSVLLDIPNFLNYYGSYKKKQPNKIKENKIKENIPQTPLKPHSVIETYNQELSGVLGVYKSFDFSPTTLENFILLMGRPEFNSIKKIRTYFKKVKNLPHLTGETSGWKASLDWLLNINNALKVFNNTYGEGEENELNLPPEERSSYLG